ncbi:hypothetical protein PG994_013832 [Apiospora phragmitis]|uniref:Uncharacterized protein n=1 Tax=Apiospora phragmitis TaxID=2905665 RepID=A0ABR1T2M0_9PEZI
MPSLVRGFASIEARDGDSGSSTLSTGGIVGVAISGALVVFVVLSLLLVCVARRQARRRRLVEQAGSATIGSPSQDGWEDKSPFPGSIFDNEGDLESIQQRHRISLPVIPPVFSRRPSLNLAPFRDDVHSSGGQSQRREKERGRELRELRRKSSWIDEDALHGPRISKPKSKHSLLSLRRKLSARQISSNPALLGSPTLPHAERKAHPGPNESNGEALPVGGDICLSFGTVLYEPRPAPQTVSAPQASPTRTQQPLAAAETTRNTYTIAFEAAQQLAGKSRLPDSQRPPRPCTSATDLSAILQLTAARLQDGNRSARRQTMFARSQQLVRFGDVQYADGGPVSPARKKSAPEVMVAELEAAEMTSFPKGPTPSTIQKSSHDRHVSHMSHVSQFSIVSEADSMLACRRGSQPDVQTALSSPSRHERAKELAQAEQNQELRPTTSGSESLAFSTLYSVDEETDLSPTKSPGTERTYVARTTHQPYERYDTSPKLPFDNGGSPRVSKLRRGTLGQFHGPRPMPRPECPAMHVSPRCRADKPLEPSSHFSIYAVDDDPFTADLSPSQNSPRLSQVFKVLPANVNRPETGPKSRDSTRATSSKPLVRFTKATATPTPSPKSLQITLPPPYVTQGIIDRLPSPTLSSRSSGSSIHESSSNGNRTSIATTIGYSTTTLLTMPSPEGSPTKLDQRPRSQAGFHRDPSKATDDEEDERRDMVHNDMPRPSFVNQSRSPSDGSVYSSQAEGEEEVEEEDRLPPLRNEATNNVDNRDSTQIASLVAELRRMNSQVSQASGYSRASTSSSTTLGAVAEVGSPTLPALRGGGFSPGKRGGTSGASRNYLAVGSPEKKPYEEGDKGVSGGAPAARRWGNEGSAGISARRGRRGTVGAGMGSGTGLASRLKELDRHMTGVSKQVVAKSPGRSSSMRVRVEASSESLYDEYGFLKSSPVGRD